MAETLSRDAFQDAEPVTIATEQDLIEIGADASGLASAALRQLIEPFGASRAVKIDFATIINPTMTGEKTATERLTGPTRGKPDTAKDGDRSSR